MRHNVDMGIPAQRLTALLWLLFIPVGAGFGGAAGSQGGASGVNQGAVIGGLIGAALAVFVIVLSWRRIGRRARVLALHPDAVVVHADKTDATNSALEAVLGSRQTSGDGLTVAFSANGVHIYQGHELRPLLAFGWESIVAIREDAVRVMTKSRPALVVDIMTERGIVPTPLVPPDRGAFFSATREVATLASEIAEVRASSAVPVLPNPASSPATRFATPPRRTLLPGVSSTRWQTVARIPPIIGVIGAAVVLGSRILSPEGVSRAGMIPAMIFIIAMTVVSLLFFVLANSAQKRERTAGYTLHRIWDVEVDQVDPKTGYIIRRAGEPQLTKAREVAELQRVRALG